MSGQHDGQAASPEYTGETALPYVTDLVWYGARLFFTVALDGWARVYELTGGEAVEVRWEGNEK